MCFLAAMIWTWNTNIGIYYIYLKTMQYISLPTKFKIHIQAKCCFTFSVYHVERKRLDLQFLVQHVEFRGQHFMLTIIKTWTKWKSTLFLHLSKECGHRANRCPHIGKTARDKEFQRTDQKPMSRNPVVPPQNPQQSRQTWTVIDKLLEAQWGQVWVLKTLGEAIHEGFPTI